MSKFNPYSIIRHKNSGLLYRILMVHYKTDWSLDCYTATNVDWDAKTASFNGIALSNKIIPNDSERHYELVI